MKKEEWQNIKEGDTIYTTQGNNPRKVISVRRTRQKTNMITLENGVVYVAWDKKLFRSPNSEYIPEDKELERMGFQNYRLYFIYTIPDVWNLVYWKDDILAKMHWRWMIIDIEKQVFPECQADVLDIIRLFTRK